MLLCMDKDLIFYYHKVKSLHEGSLQDPQGVSPFLTVPQSGMLHRTCEDAPIILSGRGDPQEAPHGMDAIGVGDTQRRTEPRIQPDAISEPVHCDIPGEEVTDPAAQIQLLPGDGCDGVSGDKLHLRGSSWGTKRRVTPGQTPRQKEISTVTVLQRGIRARAGLNSGPGTTTPTSPQMIS